MLLALLPGGDGNDALAAFSTNRERLSAKELRVVRLLLWKSTRDRSHLMEAKRLLDEAMAHVPDDSRDLMLTNLRVNRKIMAAWIEDF